MIIVYIHRSIFHMKSALQTTELHISSKMQLLLEQKVAAYYLCTPVGQGDILAKNSRCLLYKWHILYLRAVKTSIFTICNPNKDNIQNIFIKNNCLEYKCPNLQYVG